MKCASNGFQMVMPPSIFLVTLPGMFKSCNNCRLSFICRPCNKQKYTVLYAVINCSVLAKTFGSWERINPSLQKECKLLIALPALLKLPKLCLERLWAELKYKMLVFIQKGETMQDVWFSQQYWWRSKPSHTLHHVINIFEEHTDTMTTTTSRRRWYAPPKHW